MKLISHNDYDRVPLSHGQHDATYSTVLEKVEYRIDLKWRKLLTFLWCCCFGINDRVVTDLECLIVMATNPDSNCECDIAVTSKSRSDKLMYHVKRLPLIVFTNAYETKWSIGHKNGDYRQIVLIWTMNITMDEIFIVLLLKGNILMVFIYVFSDACYIRPIQRCHEEHCDAIEIMDARYLFHR